MVPVLTSVPAETASVAVKPVPPLTCVRSMAPALVKPWANASVAEPTLLSDWTRSVAPAALAKVPAKLVVPGRMASNPWLVRLAPLAKPPLLIVTAAAADSVPVPSVTPLSDTVPLMASWPAATPPLTASVRPDAMLIVPVFANEGPVPVWLMVRLLALTLIVPSLLSLP